MFFGRDSAPARFRLKGIGVDIVALPRIRKFLGKNPQLKFKRLLTPFENQSFSGKNPALVFAKFWAAKEAFFKASGKAWMGEDGFRSIEINRLPRNRFRARFVGEAQTAEGSFFRRSGLIGAQVYFWK